MPHFGAIILAAGMSSRMGDFKVLLPWKNGSPILLHVLSNYITLNIDPIIVVTGRDADRVQDVVRDLPVTCVYNAEYETGEILSSVKTGLRAMPDGVNAVFINPADMPRIPQIVIEAMQDAYQVGHIIAPRHEGQRGHPILLDRAFWQGMLELPADGAPRDLIKANRQQIRFVDTDDEGVLIDIDTPETYERERNMEETND